MLELFRIFCYIGAVTMIVLAFISFYSGTTDAIRFGASAGIIAIACSVLAIALKKEAS